MTDSSPQAPQPHDVEPAAVKVSAANGSGELDALMSLIQVIEAQPLDQRAPAFVQVHEKLRSALEGADASA